MLLGSADHKACGRKESLTEGGRRFLIFIGLRVLGILFPQLPGEGTGAEALNLGTRGGDSLRIPLLTAPYGIGHLGKQPKHPNKLQFAVIPGIFPFLTPPFHVEPLGLGMGGCAPKPPPGRGDTGR